MRDTLITGIFTDLMALLSTQSEYSPVSVVLLKSNEKDEI